MSTRHTCCFFISNLNCHCEFSPFASSSSVPTHSHTDLRGVRCSPEKNPIRNYVFKSYFHYSIFQWQWHTKLTLLVVPIFRAHFVCQTKANIKIFVGQLHTSIVVPVCVNWMNVDLRYVAKLLMFQSALHRRQSERVTLCIVWSKLSFVQTSIATTPSQTSSLEKLYYYFCYFLAENRNSLNNYVRISTRC